MNLLVRKKNKGYQYVISYKDGLTWRQTSKQGFATKGEAKRAGQARMRELEELNPIVKNDTTFKEVAELMIQDGHKSDNTLETYQTFLKAYEDIHDLPINQLTYKDVMPIIRERERNFKYGGIKHYLVFGSAVCRYAIKKLKISRVNPFEDIVLRKPIKEKEQKKVLTPSEVDQLLEELDGDVKLICAFIALAGLRISEVRGLTRSSIDLKEKTITVESQVHNEGNRGALKTSNSYRVVPLSPKLSDIYISYPAKFSGEVCKPLTTSAVNYHLNKYGISSHTLRHSFATNCISAGLDFKTVASILGNTVEMVMSTYSHVNVEMEEKARKIIESL